MAILTVLSRVGTANFQFLRTTLRLTQGNLSSHLRKLEDAGLVQVNKRFEGRKSVTTAQITESGRVSIENIWAELDTLRQLD